MSIFSRRDSKPLFKHTEFKRDSTMHKRAKRHASGSRGSNSAFRKELNSPRSSYRSLHHSTGVHHLECFHLVLVNYVDDDDDDKDDDGDEDDGKCSVHCLCRGRTVRDRHRVVNFAKYQTKSSVHAYIDRFISR